MTKTTTPQQLTPSWSLVRPSLSLVRKYIVPVLYLSALPGLLATLGLELVDNFKATGGHLAIGSILLIMGLAWSIVCIPAYYRLQLAATAQEEVDTVLLVRQNLHFVPRLIGFYIIYSILVCLCLLLLVVPGLIVLRRYFLTPYYLIDKNLSVEEAMRRSTDQTKPVKGYVWGLLGVTLVFSIVSALVNGQLGPIGILISVILSYVYSFAPVLRYAEIAKR